MDLKIAIVNPEIFAIQITFIPDSQYIVLHLSLTFKFFLSIETKKLKSFQKIEISNNPKMQSSR